MQSHPFHHDCVWRNRLLLASTIRTKTVVETWKQSESKLEERDGDESASYQNERLGFDVRFRITTT
jgi:hypothetical protein